MTLDRIRPGTRIFIDSTIFIYHYTGASLECRGLLERCERGDVRGLTSVLVLAEVAHRLMLIEAVQLRLVTLGNVARKLREKPQVVRKLRLYQQQVDRIPLMGITVVPVNLKTMLKSADYRTRHGLLTNDSLVVSAAKEAGAAGLASADRNFERLEDFQWFRPGDLEAS